MTEPNMYAGIYVKNIPKTAHIFKKALGAEERQLQPNLLELRVGKGRLLLNQQDMSQVKATNDPSGKELELGIWVDNLHEVYQKISGFTEAAEINFVSNIVEKAGIRDFRFRLPEGYYVRVTADAQS